VDTVPWTVFEKYAASYEDWYASPRGRLGAECERGLLLDLLSHFPEARSAIEIGCGTGYFSRWLRTCGLDVVGVDRAPGMLATLRSRAPGLPVVLADAGALPVARGSVDLCVFVTALEFIDDPRLALAEAAAAARQGLIAIALNRYSLGGLSRRIGLQARRPLLAQARDVSLSELQRWLTAAAGPRGARLVWASTLFPPPLRRLRARIAMGDVLGIAARFDDHSA
jgi:SAM-dependent methyltransferase